MASTVPAKTQPLHNFALPHLKWKNNHPRGGRSASASPHHQSRSQPESPSHSASPMREPPRQSPLRTSGSGDADGVSERDGLVTRKPPIEYKRHPRNSSKDGVYVSEHDRVHDKAGKKSSSELDQINSIGDSNINNSNNTGICNSSNNSNNNKEARSRFLIKISAGTRLRKSESKAAAAAEEGNQEEKKGDEVMVEDEDEPMGKTWNLRPRKPIRKSLNVSGGASLLRSAGGAAAHENRAQSAQGNLNGSGYRIKTEVVELSCGADKKDKRVRFSLALSREEIEEDIFALTGSKPARRPKKRVKFVQKQLDNVFPGLWLASITPDSYKVSENPTKG